MTCGNLKSNSFGSKLCGSALVLPAVFAAVLLLFFLLYDQSAHLSDYNGTVADAVSCFGILFSCCAAYVCYRKCLLDTKTVVFLVIVCGFTLRLAYALRYGYGVNQHDVESLESSGHLSYIYSIANGHGLPQTNDWQFSHPPLHHFLSAISVKLSYLLGFSNGRAFENIQLLTVFYSTMTMLAGYRLLTLCRVKENNLIICMALLSFHPTFQILAGSINNDVLTLLLSMYAVVYLLKWYQRPSVKYALICGAFCGLGMMTKVSAALIAVVAAVSVVIKFISCRRLKFGQTALQAVCFIAVLLPLGLWHPIRNYLLFQQPLGYVAPIPVTSALYTGDISLLDRIILPFSKTAQGVYVDVWEEYNVWFYTLRNSLFGEYKFGNEGVAAFLVLLNLILIVVSLIALVFLLFKRSPKQKCLIPLFVLYFVQLAFFVYFNLRYPFGCTMDFRYIVPLLFCGVVFIGAAAERMGQNNSSAIKNIADGVKFISVAFCVLSCIVMF